MGFWLFVNVLIGLIVPLAVVFLVAVIFLRGGDLHWPRLVRDFQLCLYCLALAAGTFYDVQVEVGRNSGAAAKSGIGSALPVTAIVLAVPFYGVSLTMGYKKTSWLEDVAIVAISASAVIATVALVLMSRYHMGFL